MDLPVFIHGAGTFTVPATLPVNETAAQVGPEVSSLPSMIPPAGEATVIDVAASTFPLKSGAPRVAELPTTQKTFFA
jgi:hypothetical protein